MNLRSAFVGAAVVWAILATGEVHAQQAQYYVLDGFGGVHAGGGAAAIAGTPYFGFDIAKGIAYVPGAAGDGILVLDGFGGVHASGLGAVAPVTPYFGFNIARAITYRHVPARINGANFFDPVTVTTFGTVVLSTTVTAPDDGFLLVIATTELLCENAAAGFTNPVVYTNVDSTSQPTGLGYVPKILECNNAVPVTLTISRMFPVAAGVHTANLVANPGGTISPRFDDNTIAAIFVDHNGSGLTIAQRGSGDLGLDGR